MDATLTNTTLPAETVADLNRLPPVAEWPAFDQFWPLTHYGRRVNPSSPPHRSIGFRLAKRGNRYGIKLLAVTIPGLGLASCDAWLRRFVQATAEAERLERGEGAAPARRQAPHRRPARAANQRERERRTDEVLARHGLKVAPAGAGGDA
jgi:hypothetical protein